MNLFLDTSALVKRYSKEKGTNEMDSIFRDKSADIWISQLATVEIASALSKKVREGVINDSSKHIAIAAFLRDYRRGRFKVIFLDKEIIRGATRILIQKGSQIPLRTLDALQLECALRLSRERTLDVMVVSDNKFKASIESIEGIEVFDPEVERWKGVKQRLARRVKSTE
jgi:predicted nucleic acid-binding protein